MTGFGGGNPNPGNVEQVEEYDTVQCPRCGKEVKMLPNHLRKKCTE